MRESDIRPQHIFNRYLELSAQDAAALLQDASHFETVDCVACGFSRHVFAFTKNGFDLRKCPNCGSLFCSPRPSFAQLAEFYTTSVSADYWAREFFPGVAEVRREKLFRPKAQMIRQMMDARAFQPEVICDVGAGYGLLLEELAHAWPRALLRAVEPGKELAKICRKKGFEVLESVAEETQAWSQTADLVTCFEVLEHVHNPSQLVGALCHLIKPAGYCLVTGLSGDGFDIQILKEKSKSIFPPHHLNFLSIKGLETLFMRAGFSSVEISTPGCLDVDIVMKTWQESGSCPDPFWSMLFDRGANARADFQRFLVEQRLSSHVWVLAQKKESGTGSIL